jgi:hypothetical protein
MTDLNTPPDVRFEAQLRRALAEDPPGPFLGPEARRRAGRPRATPWLLATAALLVVGAVVGRVAGPPPLTERGLGADPAIVLGVLLEGRGGAAQRASDRRVPPEHAIIFDVRVRDASYLCIDEDLGAGRWERVFPAAGASWRVQPGRHLPLRGDVVQAFRTDHGPGTRSYRALADPSDPACGHPAAASSVEVRWLD